MEIAIGLGVMALIVVVYIVVQTKALTVEKREFLELRDSLGLTFIHDDEDEDEDQSEREGREVSPLRGKLRGELQGYRVTVEPQAGRRRILIALRRELPLELSTWDDHSKPREGMQPFDFGFAPLNQFFVQRHADPALVPWLAAIGPDHPLASLATRGAVFFRDGRKSTGLDVSYSRIGCGPARGSRDKGIQAGAVRRADAEALLPWLIEIARSFDAVSDQAGRELWTPSW